MSNKYPLFVDQLLNFPAFTCARYAPWKHEGYRDAEGRCWFRKESDQSWFLERPDKVCNVIACLPYYALPLPEGEEEK